MPWIIGGAIAGGALISSIGAGKAADTQADATGKAVGETQRQFNVSREDLAPYREAGTAALTRLRSLLGLGDAGSGVIDESDPRYKALLDPMIADIDRQHLERFGMSAFDPRADANGTNTWVNQAKQKARDQFTAQYGTGNTSTNPEDSPLLRKFKQSDLESDVPYNSGLQFGLDEGRKAIERRASAGGGLDSGATLKALTRFGNDYGTMKAEGAYGRFVGNQGDVYGRLSGIAGLGSGATNVGVNAGANTASNLASLYTGQGNSAGAAAIAGGNAFGGGLNQFANYYSQQNLLQQLQGGGGRTPKFDANLIGPD